MSAADFVEVERRGRVGILRLVDDRKRNALSYELREAFSSGFRRLTSDPEVRALYITGRGRAFCGGGDLSAMQNEGDPWASHVRLDRTARWLTELIRCPLPVVVGVNGVAVGGGIGLALAGDLVYAGAEAGQFAAGFLRIGLLPDIGMMYTLPRLVGLARARAFVFEGQTWSAAQAEEYGLIAAALPDDDLDAHCMARAEALAAAPIEALGLAKRLMGRSFETTLEDMMTYEDLGQSLAYATESAREGIDALIAGRRPDFIAASERENATQLARRREGRATDGQTGR